MYKYLQDLIWKEEKDIEADEKQKRLKHLMIIELKNRFLFIPN